MALTQRCATFACLLLSTREHWPDWPIGRTVHTHASSCCRFYCYPHAAEHATALACSRKQSCGLQHASVNCRNLLWVSERTELLCQISSHSRQLNPLPYIHNRCPDFTECSFLDMKFRRLYGGQHWRTTQRVVAFTPACTVLTKLTLCSIKPTSTSLISIVGQQTCNVRTDKFICARN